MFFKINLLGVPSYDNDDSYDKWSNDGLSRTYFGWRFVKYFAAIFQQLVIIFWNLKALFIQLKFINYYFKAIF